MPLKNLSIDPISELLSRGVEEVINLQHLEAALRSKNKLRVKLGIDPTSPNIHIGRAVVLWKLRAFQELGHKVVFIVGDFTGLVGDTSDKDSERPMMTEAQAKANMKTYAAQAFKILDKSKTEIHYNSKWLKDLGFLELAKMADLFGLHEMSARDNVARRLSAGKRVSVREMLYPIMQGYDSVAIKADVELGGTDQRFNLLAGRTIQPSFRQAPQDILMTSIMEGTDGRKMSSSWGNVINIRDEPHDMFGKVMSIPDELIKKYFILATRKSIVEIEQILKLPNPRDQKELLALAITELYYDEKRAESARQYFIEVFRNKGMPDKIEEKTFKQGQYKLSEILISSGLVSSKSEARRLFDQKGVKLNDVVTTDCDIELDGTKPRLIQIGKRKFLRVK